MTNNKNTKIKILHQKTGCSLSNCKKAIEFCQEHPECNEIGYLKAISFALATPKLTFLERVKYFSNYN